jgi:lipopolysaccharide export system protein LptA
VKIFSFKYPFGVMLAILLGLSMLTMPVTTGRADNQTPTPQTTNPETKKINISAQRLISNTADNNAEFIGNVRASQGETQITADSLKIFFSGKSEAGAASPAQSLEKFMATGNVEIKFDNRVAVALRRRYI